MTYLHLQSQLPLRTRKITRINIFAASNLAGHLGETGHLTTPYPWNQPLRFPMSRLPLQNTSSWGFPQKYLRLSQKAVTNYREGVLSGRIVSLLSDEEIFIFKWIWLCFSFGCNIQHFEELYCCIWSPGNERERCKLIYCSADLNAGSVESLKGIPVTELSRTSSRHIFIWVPKWGLEAN